MMRALILLHRWLGVAFCPLFAIWFASGAVMHFVPFPAQTEAERLAGLASLDLPPGIRGPAQAVSASGMTSVSRLSLFLRSDGPVYLISGSGGVVALFAADLSNAAVRSPALALAIAKDFANHREWDNSSATVVGLKAYDQWTVASEYNRDRPLYRVALHDERGTELYVSSATGEIVLDTNLRQRTWNYVGSIAHWIYPTVLRRHHVAWTWLVWGLSFLALIGACAGALVGMLQLIGGTSSHYRGWQLWHYRLGLAYALFLLSWLLSGFLSMDDGTLFSTGRPTRAEIAAVIGRPNWSSLPPDELAHLSPQTVQTEWFAFGGQIYRRERTVSGSQKIATGGSRDPPSRSAFLKAAEVNAIGESLGHDCERAVVGRADNYAPAPTTAGAPVYRLACDNDWFYIDASDGALLAKLDSSRRAYRWLFEGLHTLDFPALTARPEARRFLIILLCTAGFAFSVTGMMIAYRRVTSPYRRTETS
ncbi:MAG TPA: PepSY domain-containing protein [Xanthobacteraceae bacterium]|nr:PepSY domain-containing protein [Xanthobacteraceae bacterium]